jgi:hypothetical protein
MPELLERPLEEVLAEKLSLLEEASFALLTAIESGDPDLIARAKRRLGLVLADL